MRHCGSKLNIKLKVDGGVIECSLSNKRVSANGTHQRNARSVRLQSGERRQANRTKNRGSAVVDTNEYGVTMLADSSEMPMDPIT